MLFRSKYISHLVAISLVLFVQSARSSMMCDLVRSTDDPHTDAFACSCQPGNLKLYETDAGQTVCTSVVLIGLEDQDLATNEYASIFPSVLREGERHVPNAVRVPGYGSQFSNRFIKEAVLRGDPGVRPMAPEGFRVEINNDFHKSDKNWIVNSDLPFRLNESESKVLKALYMIELLEKIQSDITV